MRRREVLRRVADDRSLRRGVLIAAFAGWNDAGDAATGAIDALAHLTEASTVAEIDPEEFFDFQVSRPVIETGPDGARVLRWPHNRFQVADVGDRDLLVLSGSEPNVRWRGFADTVLDYAQALDVTTVVCVGALQVDTPHTRPVPLSGRDGGDVFLGLGVRPSDYEGPTGITGVLAHTAHARGLRTASLWAGVPHYLAGATYAAAAHALASVTARALEVDVDLEPLGEAAEEQADEIAEVVAGDADLAGYVAELEQRVDADPAFGQAMSDLRAGTTTGDELGEAFEQYLRDQEQGDG